MPANLIPNLTLGFTKDARTFQVLFLSLFLILGVSNREWTIPPEKIGVTIAACLITQALCSLGSQWLKNPLTNSATSLNLLSSLISALGLCLLLRSQSNSTMIFASFIAIASKFIFQINGKHWFNPTNFGIVIALLFSQDAWISPGQWGHELWLVLIFAGLGGIVLKKVGRWDTSIVFFCTYALLEGIRNFYLGWTVDVLLHRLSSGSLLLFTLFMITDPRSTPNAKTGRMIWALTVAVLTFILQNYFFVSAAPFWALFVCAPLSILCDRTWQAPRFNWLSLGKFRQLKAN